MCTSLNCSFGLNQFPLKLSDRVVMEALWCRKTLKKSSERKHWQVCWSKYECFCSKLKSNDVCSFLCVSRMSVMLLLGSLEVWEFKHSCSENGMLSPEYLVRSSMLCTVSDAESGTHLLWGALRLSKESTECLFADPEAVCFCCYCNGAFEKRGDE